MNPTNRSAPPLVIVGCSRRKWNTLTPVPALDLYEGACVPRLRLRLGHLPELRARLRILSAEHGLVDANRRLLPYDRKLTSMRAGELRPQTAEALRREFETVGVPQAILVVAELVYQSLVVGFLESYSGCPQPEIISDIRDWVAVSAVLDSWGWP